MSITVSNPTLKVKQFKLYRRNQYMVLEAKDSIILMSTDDPDEIKYYNSLQKLGLNVIIK